MSSLTLDDYKVLERIPINGECSFLVNGEHRWTGIRRFENGQQVLTCELCGDHQTGWVEDGERGKRYSDTEAMFGIPTSMLRDDERPVKDVPEGEM